MQISSSKFSIFVFSFYFCKIQLIMQSIYFYKEISNSSRIPHHYSIAHTFKYNPQSISQRINPKPQTVLKTTPTHPSE